MLPLSASVFIVLDIWHWIARSWILAPPYSFMFSLSTVWPLFIKGRARSHLFFLAEVLDSSGISKSQISKITHNP